MSCEVLSVPPGRVSPCALIGSDMSFAVGSMPLRRRHPPRSNVNAIRFVADGAASAAVSVIGGDTPAGPEAATMVGDSAV